MSAMPDSLGETAWLYDSLSEHLEHVRVTLGHVERVDWLNQSAAKPHLESAAQALFTAMLRMEQAASVRFGAAEWREAIGKTEEES